MDTYGELRTSEVARLLGVDQTQAETELEAFAFVDPDTVKHTEDGWTAAWVPRADFLSGNVRARLTRVGEVLEQLVETATATATGDETAQLMVRRLQAAETALTEVLPEDLGPTEIVAQLGVPWVPATTVEQFLRETLDDRTVEVEHPGGSVWSVRGNRHSVAARNTWGTERASAIDIVQACLEQRADPGHRRDPGRAADPERDRHLRRSGEGRGAAGSVRDLAVGGPRPVSATRPRLQRQAERDRAALLRRRRGQALPGHGPCPRRTPAAAATAPARRSGTNGGPALSAVGPRGRGRQDPRRGDRCVGAATVGTGAQTRGRGVQPHA